MTPIDLTKVFKKSHVGKWVALSRNRIVGVGSTPKKAIEQARKGGYTDPVLHKVLPFDRAFAPNTL